MTLETALIWLWATAALAWTAFLVTWLVVAFLTIQGAA